MAKEGDISELPSKDFEVAVDESAKGAATSQGTMGELEQMIFNILSTLPRLNRNALRFEMENMSVKIQQNPTTNDLHEGLSKAQGYKDRLAEIHNLASREFKTRERCVDMLFDANNVVSKGKSADVRRGEATMKYPHLLIQLEAAETFVKEVEQVLQNIKSAHESVSRQISLMQIQLQLGEIRREQRTPNNDVEGNGSSINKGEMDWDSLV